MALGPDRASRRTRRGPSSQRTGVRASWRLAYGRIGEIGVSAPGRTGEDRRHHLCPFQVGAQANRRHGELGGELAGRRGHGLRRTGFPANRRRAMGRTRRGSGWIGGLTWGEGAGWRDGRNARSGAEDERRRRMNKHTGRSEVQRRRLQPLFLTTSSVFFAPQWYNLLIQAFRNPLVMLVEIILAFFVIFHGVNGLRLAYVDLFRPDLWEKKATPRIISRMIVVAIVLWLPALAIMGYNLLRYGLGLFGGD